jgi:hypothetical protein
VFVAATEVVARYRGLRARDASGRLLRATLSVDRNRLLLRIDDSGARYPLTVDPYIQLGTKLAAADGIGSSRFGSSVALSADGSTAIVGGPGDNGGQGAAWVFTRSGTTWSEQGGKLTPSDESGIGAFGSAVALSSDGSTALIGAHYDGGQVGAAWVFTRTGSSWSQQGAKLTGSDEVGKGEFGTSVALSGDGGTAIVGAPFDQNPGAIWTFRRTGASWAQAGGKLSPSGESGYAEFGLRVAIAADGCTLLVGAPSAGPDIGAAFAYGRDGRYGVQLGAPFWSPEATLVGNGETGHGGFGTGVALSADGSTALVGAANDSGDTGAAWAFARTGTSWAAQGGKLTANDESGNGGFGTTAALTGDGKTALIGGLWDANNAGAAWVYTRTAATWSQQGTKLTAAGATRNALFGNAVALAADGSTVLLAGENDAGLTGSVWTFGDVPPAVSSIAPAAGPASGGTVVTITGNHFSGVSTVRFGPTPSQLIKVLSDTQASAVAPPGKAGTVDVTVTSPTGTSAMIPGDAYTYMTPTTTTTGTTTTGSATTGTTTTRRATPASAGPVARIVYAIVVSQGSRRILEVRIRVSEPARAHLDLLGHRVNVLSANFPVRGGANVLKALIPAHVTAGLDQLKVALEDTRRRSRGYTAAVLVPG